MRADHEFYCSNTAPINHKVTAGAVNPPDDAQVNLSPILPGGYSLCVLTPWLFLQIHLRHEESASHVKSALDMSYGKHWDEINNKRTLLLSQSFKNQSTQNHTSYTLEVGIAASVMILCSHLP